MHSLDLPQSSQNDERETKRIAEESAQRPETVDLLNQPSWTHPPPGCLSWREQMPNCLSYLWLGKHPP